MAATMPRPETSKLSIDCVLREGRAVRLRPIRPDDRDRLRAGFARLSYSTRVQRFFQGITQLSDTELDYLTQVDGVNHVAWAAVDPSTPDEAGLGMGRFVRLEGEPTVAEFALVVIDAWQHRGLGRLLLALLLIEGEELGLRALRGVVLTDNERMLRWMRGLGAELLREDTMACVFELPVGRPSPAYPDSVSAVRLEEDKCDLRALLKARGPLLDGRRTAT
jgi:RimJ/RimL family protein N-acetyltransferase